MSEPMINPNCHESPQICTNLNPGVDLRALSDDELFAFGTRLRADVAEHQVWTAKLTTLFLDMQAGAHACVEGAA